MLTNIICIYSLIFYAMQFFQISNKICESPIISTAAVEKGVIFTGARDSKGAQKSKI